MADQPIGIGIIGAGGIVTRRHLPGFREIQGCRVVAVHNRRRANAESVAKEWGIPHVVDSPEEVYTRKDVDAVLIGTTPYLHRDLTLAALDAGKHVFCQARMSRDLAEAREMLAAAEAHPDLVTMVCRAPRVDPVERMVVEILQQGRLGQIRLVRVQHLSGGFADPAQPLHWRMDHHLSGRNIHTMGQYVEVMNRWFGPAVSVMAHGKVFTQQRPDPDTGEMREVLVPDLLTATGELKNGAQFVYSFGTVLPLGDGERVEIHGSQGSLVYTPENRELRVGVGGNKDGLQVVSIPEDYPLPWSMEQDFVNAIRHGTPVYPSFRDGVGYMEFMEAVGLSLEQGKMVRLPL